jgi:sugar phosphate isomerase/epimerase
MKPLTQHCPDVLLLLSLSLAFPASQALGDGSTRSDIWAHDNLFAWCVVPFDAKARTPEQRAEMLEELGFRNFAYDWRQKDIPTFDEEIDALQRHGINLIAWWFPFDAEDPEAKAILEIFKRHYIHPQLWVIQSVSQFLKAPEDIGKFLPEGFPVPRNEQEFSRLSDANKAIVEKVLAQLKKSAPNSHFPKTPEEQDQRVRSEAERIEALAKLAAPYGCTIELYNHNGWFGREENQLAIIERLKEMGETSVGMVYNFSHSRDALHDDSKDFPELWSKIKGHVVAVDISGMRFEGNEVFPSQGDSELAMMRTIQDSGWKGLVGLIAEKGGDAKVTLSNYLTGLDWLAAEFRQPGSGGPKPFAPAP